MEQRPRTTLERAAAAYRALLLAEAGDALVALQAERQRATATADEAAVTGTTVDVPGQSSPADRIAVERKVETLARRLALAEDPIGHDWTAIFLLERALLETIDARRLERRAWAVRNRYREVAGETKYALYTASRPQPKEGQRFDGEMLRADLLELYRELEREYLFADALEQQRAAMSKAIAVLTVSILGVLVALLAFAAVAPDYRGWSIAMVFVAAAIWVVGANKLRTGKWRRS
jgi:hypothetical protein